MPERLPWFARAWTRPSTGRRLAWGAAGYLFAAGGLLVLALLRDGVGVWLSLVGAGCFLWLGGTLAATLIWRRSHPTPT